MSSLAARGRLQSRPGGADWGAVPSPVADDVAVEVQRLPGRRARPGREDLLVVPPNLSRPVPLLVAFHGAGGTAEGMLPMLRSAAAARGVLLLLPTSAGSTWDLIAGRLGPDVAALDDALAAVFAHHPVSRVALGGFSDGASYALSLGLANGDLTEAVVAFSPGFAMPPEQVGAPRVWISHGTADRVLPVDRCGRRVARVLGEAGYAVRYEEFDGPHVAPPDLVDAALDWWLL